MEAIHADVVYAIRYVVSMQQLKQFLQLSVTLVCRVSCCDLFC